MPIPVLAYWAGLGAVTLIGSAYAYGSASSDADVDLDGGDYVNVDLGPVAYYAFLSVGLFIAYKVGSKALEAFTAKAPGV